MVGDIVINTQTWENTLTSAQGCTQKFMYYSRAQLNARLLWIPWKSGISSDQTCKLGAPHSLLQSAVLQIRLYKARSKSGKQVRQGAAWMTACETLLLETGSAPAFPFLWRFPFRFGSTVYLCLFWRFFSFECCILASQGSRAMGAPAKKSFVAPASRVLASHFICFGILAQIQTPYKPSHCWQQWVCQFPVSLSIRGIIRASPTSAREGNYLETYVAIAT